MTNFVFEFDGRRFELSYAELNRLLARGVEPVPIAELDEATRTAPERIFLQISDDEEHLGEPFPEDEVTWCRNSVVACEVEYVRADLYAAPTCEPVPPDAELDNAIAFAETYSRRGDYPRFDANWDKIIGGVAALRQQNAELREEIAETREILAGSDYGSLPNDWTLPRIADARMDDINKLTWQVRNTCTRAETAERERDELRKDAQRYRWLRTEPIDGRKRDWLYMPHTTELDATIDAAISADDYAKQAEGK